MNIFIIPSWYPDTSNPVGGIFIKEQAEALADLNPQHNFIVSHCENFYLSITKPSGLVKTLRKYSDKKHFVNNVKQNLFEYYRPAVSWTEKFGGEIKNILKAHIQNFTEAANNLGKIDLLHAHVSYPAGFSAMKIKEQFNVPFIITEHMAPFPFEQFIQNGTLSDKISKPIQNADEIITVSNYSAEKIKSFGLRKPVVIPNMINENVFYPPDNKLQTRKIKFLTATTFIESKGIRELMEGILRSDKAHLNTGFTIAGTGYMDEYIEQFIAQNSLADKVILVKDPSREELTELFRACDVFILPSRLESFGIVYVEALACGKPVIATDCGGPADFMKNFTGMLIPVNDPQAVSDAIKFMTENISKYQQKRIRQYFLMNYSQQAVCPEIIEVYRKVLKTN